MNLDSLEIDDISFWGTGNYYNGGLKIDWSGNMGWGELDIVIDKNNKLVAFTECMDTNEDKKFVKKIMELLVEKLIIVE